MSNDITYNMLDRMTDVAVQITDLWCVALCTGLAEVPEWVDDFIGVYDMLDDALKAAGYDYDDGLVTTESIEEWARDVPLPSWPQRGWLAKADVDLGGGIHAIGVFGGMNLAELVEKAVAWADAQWDKRTDGTPETP